MEIASYLLNQSITCECGEHHIVPIEAVVISQQLDVELGQYLFQKQHQKLLLVADLNTHSVIGKRLLNRLLNAGFEVDALIFPYSHGLLPDENAIDQVREQLNSTNYDIALAVGSGVINDIVRYSTFCEGLSYICIATAPSMDGYASNMSAMQFSGLKVTVPTQTPKAIFTDPEILAEAPFELLQSGFGDLVGKVISLSDWLLAKTLYRERFCKLSFNLIYEPLVYIVQNPQKLVRRDTGVVTDLFIGLINSGISMAIMGNSRPCSGSEHHCSHFWDFVAYKGQRDHASHGLQVGCATYWMMKFYTQVLKTHILHNPIIAETTENLRQFADDFYGSAATAVLQTQIDKVAWLKEKEINENNLNVESIKSALDPTIQLFDETERALAIMGIPKLPESIGASGAPMSFLKETFQHAKDLRSRYTVFDFLAGQGLLSKAISEVLNT